MLRRPKISTNRVKRSFFAQRANKTSAEGRSPPQELEVSPRSRLYLLVFFTFHGRQFYLEPGVVSGHPAGERTAAVTLGEKYQVTGKVLEGSVCRKVSEGSNCRKVFEGCNCRKVSEGSICRKVLEHNVCRKVLEDSSVGRC